MNRLPILSIPGVVHVVGTGKIPAPIEESEIAAIQVAVKSGLPSEPWPAQYLGQRVRIEHGPLSGIEGMLLGFRGQRRLILSITLLQRSVAVQVDEAWVQPIRLQHRACSAPLTPQSVSMQPIAYTAFDVTAGRFSELP
jgi:transcription antitermination factor NusG